MVCNYVYGSGTKSILLLYKYFYCCKKYIMIHEDHFSYVKKNIIIEKKFNAEDKLSILTDRKAEKKN